jgi:hypothetical protein
VIQTIEINIGKKLAGEIADGNGSLSLQRCKKIVTVEVGHNAAVAARGDDFTYEPERVGACYSSRYHFHEQVMINALEVLLDVTFEHVPVLSRKYRVPVYCRVSAFALSAGIGIENEAFFKNRFYDIAKGMMHDAVLVWRCADQPSLWIINDEVRVLSMLVISFFQGSLERQQLLFQVQVEKGGTRLEALTLFRLLGGKEKVFKRRNPFKQVLVRLHVVRT